MKSHVHALSGAAVGSLLRHPVPAFAGGVASHILLDILPHNDEVHPADPLLTAGCLGGIAALFGSCSPEMWGAVGALVPDLEHLVFRGGRRWMKIFPAHTAWSRTKHGPRAEYPIVSAAVALCSIAALLYVRRLRTH